MRLKSLILVAAAICGLSILASDERPAKFQPAQADKPKALQTHHLMIWGPDEKLLGEFDSFAEVVDLKGGKFYFKDMNSGKIVCAEGPLVITIK